MDTTKVILAVIATLNAVEVKGEENMDRLLGCINALRQLVKEEEKNDGKQRDK